MVPWRLSIRIDSLWSGLARRQAAAKRELEEARRSLEELGALWHSEEAAALMREGQRAAAPSDKPAAPGGLTPREIGVLKLVAAGLSNRTIGRKLFVSELTVKRHVANVLAKLELPSRAAAATYAAKTGLV